MCIFCHIQSDNSDTYSRKEITSLGTTKKGWLKEGGGKDKTEINVPKRFPKKQGEKESHDPIDVIRIPIDKFKINQSKPEIMSVKSKKDIF